MPEGSADRIELGHLGQARRAVERPADGRFPLVRLLPIQSGRIFRTGRRCRSPARRSTLLRHRLQQQIAPPGGRNGRIHRNGLDGSCCWAVRIAGRYGERDADGNSQRYRIHCRRRNDDNGCPFRQITDPSSRWRPAGRERIRRNRFPTTGSSSSRCHQTRFLPASSLTDLPASAGPVRRRLRLRWSVRLWRRLRRIDPLLPGRMRIFLHSPSPPTNSSFTQTGRLPGCFPSIRMPTRGCQWLHHRCRLFRPG